MTQDPINVFDELRRLSFERERLNDRRIEAKNQATLLQKQVNDNNAVIEGCNQGIESVERKIVEVAKLLNK